SIPSLRADAAMSRKENGMREFRHTSRKGRYHCSWRSPKLGVQSPKHATSAVSGCSSFMRHEIEFLLNGQAHRIEGDQVFVSLTDFLRDTLGLTGTKVVCAEGDCGACTVLLGRVSAGRLRYESADACLLFLYQLHATHLVTIEGLGGADTLDPIQLA